MLDFSLFKKELRITRWFCGAPYIDMRRDLGKLQQIFYGELDGGRDNKGSVGRPVTWCCGCELRPRSVLGLETNVKVTHVRVCFLLCGAIGSSTADTSWGEVPSVQQN